MKNNTKVRLHLSKQLFESLAKQVLAEAKKGDMSGGAYTEAVKATKGEKKEKTPKAEEPKEKEVKSEANSAPATKGASKQQVGTSLINKGRDLAKNPKANLQSSESGKLLDVVAKLIDIADDPSNASTVLDKVARFIAQNKPKDKLPAPPKEERPGGPFFEMETITAERDEINELDPQTVSAMQQGFTHLHPEGVLAQLTPYVPALIAILGGAVALGPKLKKAGVSDKDAAKAVEAAKKIEKEAK